jgi:hypothetical protein
MTPSWTTLPASESTLHRASFGCSRKTICGSHRDPSQPELPSTSISALLGAHYLGEPKAEWRGSTRSRPTRKNSMIISYARVSTADQNLAPQRNALTDVGCEKIFTEHVSGAAVERPALREVMLSVNEATRSSFGSSIVSRARCSIDRHCRRLAREGRRRGRGRDRRGQHAVCAGERAARSLARRHGSRPSPELADRRAACSSARSAAAICAPPASRADRTSPGPRAALWLTPRRPPAPPTSTRISPDGPNACWRWRRNCAAKDADRMVAILMTEDAQPAGAGKAASDRGSRCRPGGPAAGPTLARMDGPRRGCHLRLARAGDA